MKTFRPFAVLAVIVVSTFSFSGCGGGRPEGDLPVSDTPITPEASAEKAKEVMKGQGGMYKGAPGMPKPPGA